MEEQDLDSVKQDADPIRQDNDFKTVNVGSGVRVEGRIDGAETADISGALSGTLKSSNININKLLTKKNRTVSNSFFETCFVVKLDFLIRMGCKVSHFAILLLLREVPCQNRDHLQAKLVAT